MIGGGIGGLPVAEESIAGEHGIYNYPRHVYQPEDIVRPKNGRD
jgi:hypothetical protein